MKSLFLALLGGIIMSSTKTEHPASPTTSMNPLHSVQVTDVAGLLTDGTLDVSQFVCNNGRIWAICRLRGIIGVIHIDQDCTIPVTVGDCDGGIRFTSEDQRSLNNKANMHDCECLTITFESCSISPRLPSSTLTLNPQQLPCGVPDFPGDALCCANRLIGTSGSSIYEICGCMNRLL